VKESIWANSDRSQNRSLSGDQRGVCIRQSRLPRGQPRAIDQLRQTEVQNSDPPVLLFRNVMDGDDPWMIERGGGLRFLYKAETAVAVSYLVRRK
jgi:hypothetical protein